MDDDPLDGMLGEWRAPEPPAAMDERMLAAFRSRSARKWHWAPAPAAALVIAAALLIGFRWGQPRTPPIHGYVTRIDAQGFQPLPNGAARVARREEVRQ